MSLIDLIKQHALEAAQSANWQSVADTLNALTTEVRVTELRTASWLMLQLTGVVRLENGIPITEADIVLGTLQNPNLPPRVKAAYVSLCNGGLDLSEEQVQQMIPLLAAAGSWPNGLADKVIQAGRRDVAVLDRPTTAEECRTTWGLAAVQARIDAADDAARTEARKAGATEQSIMAAAVAAWGA